MIVLINGEKKEFLIVDDEFNFFFFNDCCIFSLLKFMLKMRDCKKWI